jgi:predicted metalloprotease
MRWEGREQSQNVEDRRGMPVGKQIAMGGGLMTLLMVLLISFLGGDPRGMIQQQQKQAQAAPAQKIDPRQLEAEKPLKDFVSVVLKDTEDVWDELTPQLRQLTGNNRFTYVKPNLVLFSGRVESACGMANAAVGPFYCPADRKVYLDLAFFQELKQRFKAPGDFAMAYVVAHEVGHHLQNLLGLSEQVQMRQQRSSKAEGNQWSVRLELQADYLAGVWAHHAQQMKSILESGDLQEALNAATKIGDDKIQEQAMGYVRPDAFTHGSAEQRVRWLKAGLQSGDLSQMMKPFELPYEQL